MPEKIFVLNAREGPAGESVFRVGGLACKLLACKLSAAELHARSGPAELSGPRVGRLAWKLMACKLSAAESAVISDCCILAIE